MLRDVGVALVCLLFSVLFVVNSTNAEAVGFARFEPFVYALGALALGLPVHWINRSRRSPPPPVPPAVDVRVADVARRAASRQRLSASRTLPSSTMTAAAATPQARTTRQSRHR